MSSTTFKSGATYYTRSICDHDCILRLTVASRTAKTVTMPNVMGQRKILRIAVDDRGNEYVKPWGSYSMCPIIDATDTDVLP